MHRETLDSKFAAKGQLFRIVVIGVRGKAGFIYLESSGGTPKSPESRNFGTFVPYAQELLASARFPVA